MAVSKDCVEYVLGRFAMLFPLPVPGVPPDELVGIWVALLVDCDEAAFTAAVVVLARKLKRFPFPADVYEQIAQAPSAPAATETVAGVIHA